MKENRRTAAALSYDKSKNEVPRMTAIGKGMTAERIIEKAMEHNIPIVEDPTLVGMLKELNVNEAIPEELYYVVAEVFAYIYQMDKEIKQ